MDLVSQNLLLSSGGKKDSTYVDDVFSTYLYTGNQTARSINNGVDLSKGGLVWTKRRSGSGNHMLYDTVRGATKYVKTNQANAEGNDSNTLTSFNNNGFSLGGDTGSNDSGTFASWSFRQQKGFFDIVTYTGNGANRTIDHSLGCIPGSIWIKQLNGAGEWINYHCGIGAEKFLQVNNTEPKNDDASIFQDTEPTASVFSLGTHAYVNGNGNTYVAYLFAGNLSDSVHFDGSGDYIQSGNGNAFTHGTNDFTIECWAKFEDASPSRGVYQHNGLMTQNIGTYPAVGHDGNNWAVYGNGGNNYYTGGGARTANKWYHLAHVRHSGTTKLYVDGVEKVSFTDTYSYGTVRILIGGYYNSTYLMKGNVTNWRLVKGRALYTSNFTPPTTPLGKTYDGDGNMDTFFLCCNTGSPTGYTIDDTGNGITANADPQQSSDVPSTFGELTALFGEDEDKSIIKCGSYVGKSGANTVNLAWEPQWVIVKNVDTVEPWVMMDSMRGWAKESSGAVSLKASSTSNESAYNNWGPTATGWKLDLNNAEIDQNEKNYIYIAIRRSTGQVGKPAEAGTDVFAMDTGNGSSTIPTFDSGFPVDFALRKEPATTAEWAAVSRLTFQRYLVPNNTAAQGNYGYFTWDSSLGFGTNFGSGVQAWMWKRHAGFDVVTYDGEGGTSCIQHSLGKIPEMYVVKRRNSTENWLVYHKGLNGGSSPENYRLFFNDNGIETYTFNWGQTAPTANCFTVSDGAWVNGTGSQYLAILFASVDGISKVGSYTGNGSATSRTITTGFQPRFLILKNSEGYNNWFVLDTVRGWVSGIDQTLSINSTNPNYGGENVGHPVSTGFTINNAIANFNENGTNYIYYAHA